MYSNNNYGGGGRSYGGRSYGSYRGGSYGRQSQPRKHTGCRSGNTKNNTPYVRGWNYSKQHGMVAFFAAPYSGTHVSESKNGRQWQNWMIKVQPKMGKEFIVSGLYDMQTGRVISQQLGIVMNPRTNYCGRFTRGKN